MSAPGGGRDVPPARAASPSPAILRRSSGGAKQHNSGSLLREQLALRPRGDGALELVPLQQELSFEKGLFVVVRAIQLLTQAQPDRVIVVGLAGPSGAGKTELSRRLRELLPGSTALTLDNFLNTETLLENNYDDPRLTDFGALCACLDALRARQPAVIPLYDFKHGRRAGSETVRLGTSGVVLVEGIYALHQRVRSRLDLSVAIHGGVHYDLIKRIQRDVSRCSQSPQEIIQQISETVFPMYRLYIEPDLQTASIRIRNSFNPFSGFLTGAVYTLKSSGAAAAAVSHDDVRRALAACAGAAEAAEAEAEAAPLSSEAEHTVDLYLMPPGEDAETCRDWIRMRLRDGKYSLLFEEALTDGDLMISPSLCFDVPVRTLGGLMALGYTLGAIIKRDSDVFRLRGLQVKFDRIPQLDQHFLQVEGQDRAAVEACGQALGLAGSYIPRSYIEQVQLLRLMQECPPRLDDFVADGEMSSILSATPPPPLPPLPPAAAAAAAAPPLAPALSPGGGTRLLQTHTRHPGVAAGEPAATPRGNARRLLSMSGSYDASEAAAASPPVPAPAPAAAAAAAAVAAGEAAAAAVEERVASLESMVASMLRSASFGQMPHGGRLPPPPPPPPAPPPRRGAGAEGWEVAAALSVGLLVGLLLMGAYRRAER